MSVLIATAVILVGLAPLLGGLSWISSLDLHTGIEIGATLISGFVAVLAFVRYFSDKDKKFLLLGIGFLGTSLLDAYHFSVTASYINSLALGELQYISPWSWFASRLYLSMFMILSWLISIKASRPIFQRLLNTSLIYMLAFGAVIVCVVVVSLPWLPAAYQPGFIVGRPQELIPAVFFATAAFGYWQKKTWQTDNIEYYLLLSLLINTLAQIAYMVFSEQLWDAYFDMAHLLKVISYITLLIGELKNVYDAFVEKNQDNLTLIKQLQISNKDLEQFAYIASHDLRAPLRGIHNAANWIEEDAGHLLPPKSAVHLSKVIQRTTRLEKLLEDLLVYSRVGRVDTKNYDIELPRLVEQTLELLSLPEHVKVDLNIAPCLIHKNPAGIELILRNLVGNAVKHGNPSGTNISIVARRDDSMIQIIVKDDGPGIDSQHHARIFGLFQTLRPRDQVEGSGMGLAIVKKTLDNVGGTIAVESALGAGATFSVLWPLDW